MVAGHKLVNLGAYGELPTMQLELRIPGHSSLFETTAGLAVEAGLPRTVPYRVTAQFSPDGTMVAVSLDQLRPGSGATHGLIVVRSDGSRVVAVRLRASVGASWCYHGHRLPFGGVGAGVIDMKDVPRRSTGRTIGIRDGSLSGCLWSPRGDYLACDDYQAGKRFIVNVAKAKALGPLPLRLRGRYALAWQPGKAA